MTYQAKMWVIGSKGVKTAGNIAQTLMNVPSWAISKFQWGSPYTHIAIAQNPKRTPMMCWEAVAHGVVYHEWDESKSFDMFYVPCDMEKLLNAHLFLKAQEGKGYDYMGLFGFLWRSNEWQNDNKWFCSELAAAAMQRSGFVEGPNANVMKPHQLSPTLLLASAKGPYTIEEVCDGGLA